MTQSHDKPTADTGELRAKVEQTRQDLGETVEALAAKADVKTRAQEKAVAIKGQTATKAAELRGQAVAKATDAAHVLQEKVPDQVKDKAAAATGQVKAAAGQATEVWHDKAPEQVRNRRTAYIAGGAVLAATYVLVRRKRKHGSAL
ncbi:hypothetical protein GCM10010277_71180 [Streptomyces longisporoflavus]|uniref:DUF3618 domain-containing protein n=1 Tax=Streptomyces longisporoflavus TaxID=28044 RepID=UPI00167CFFD9|nr:DUF3618 domain-containing protein [Streptomyces longisporoflavus]GGV64443.1 hypothetical protein GCM10010277_71180 [Streptomyces longisporoflavus]